ncbi:unnamed protein product [Cladocopium goreaui]|uniref:Uncharacterized protein n=1 Tax=Cladocopium goreaui TaxID=2562237 RepID=A0A9P1BV04_9DINO|nr:unnamed protein product [Cladocopium goreaui]
MILSTIGIDHSVNGWHGDVLVRLRSAIPRGVAIAFVVAAVALWGWALVLLLVRLNALRSPHEQPQMLDLQQEKNGPYGPLPAPAVTEVLALPAPESD